MGIDGQEVCREHSGMVAKIGGLEKSSDTLFKKIENIEKEVSGIKVYNAKLAVLMSVVMVALKKFGLV